VITSPAEEARVREITEAEIQRLTVTEEEKERLRRSRVIPEGSQLRLTPDSESQNEQENGTESEQDEMLIDLTP
jgi:hypothetical protein